MSKIFCFSILIFLQLTTLASSGFAQQDCSKLKADLEAKKIGLEEVKAQLEEQKQSLPRLKKATETWNEFAVLAKAGEISTKLNDPTAVQKNCREAVDACGLQIYDLCITTLKPPIQNRDAALHFIDKMHSLLREILDHSEDTTRLSDYEDEIAKLSRKLSDCENQQAETSAKQIEGQWVNSKGTMIVETINQPDIGIEGQLVKVPPNWPKNIKRGAIFFRSRTHGESAASNVQGKTLSGNCITVPQEDDCPNLAKSPRYDPCSLALDASGDEITLKEIVRKYNPKSCEWSDVTSEETFQWRRVLDRAK